MPELEARRRRFFHALERDPSITSAGVAEGRESLPMYLVPSNQFAQMTGLWTLEEDRTERTIYPVVDVTLVSPVLIHGQRSWVFRPIDGLPEFSAIMKDKRFLTALAQAHVQERLRTGIVMTIRLEIKEERVNGAWKDKQRGRPVIEVISPQID